MQVSRLVVERWSRTHQYVNSSGNVNNNNANYTNRCRPDCILFSQPAFGVTGGAKVLLAGSRVPGRGTRRTTQL